MSSVSVTVSLRPANRRQSSNCAK